MRKYDRRYFADHRDGALASARAMVPHIVQLAGPQSVVDIGCGVGAWLSVFSKLGVSELVGHARVHEPDPGADQDQHQQELRELLSEVGAAARLANRK